MKKHEKATEALEEEKSGETEEQHDNISEVGVEYISSILIYLR